MLRRYIPLFAFIIVQQAIALDSLVVWPVAGSGSAVAIDAATRITFADTTISFGGALPEFAVADLRKLTFKQGQVTSRQQSAKVAAPHAPVSFRQAGGTFSVTIDCTRPSAVTIRFIATNGRVAQTVPIGYLGRGVHTIDLSDDNLARGIYILSVAAGAYVNATGTVHIMQ